MSQTLKIKVFLVAAILINYFFKIPQLVDQYHVSRFAFMSVLLILGVSLILPSFKKIDFNIIDTTIFAFFGINILSLFWANEFSEAIFTAQKQFILAISYYLFRLILCSKDNYQAFITNILLIVTVLAILGISFDIIQVGIDKGFGGKAIYSVVTNSGHKNLVSSFLFLLMGLNIFFYQSKKNNFLFYILIAWQLLLILLLRSRAVYLACALMGLVLGAYYMLSGSKYKELVLKRVLPIGVGVTLLGGIIITQTNAGKDYAEYLNPATYLSSASSIERLFVWSKTSELIKDEPLLGVGTGNWKIMFPSKSIGGGFRLQEQDIVFTRVHNDFLEVWAELGALGGLLYLLIFGIAFVGIRKGVKLAKPAAKNKRMILLTVLLGYFVISFLDFPKERIEHIVLFALLLAAIAWKSNTWLKKQKPYFELNSKQLKILALVLTAILLFHLPSSYFRLKGDFYSKKLFIEKERKNYSVMMQHAEQAGSAWNVIDPIVIPYRWYQGLGLYMESKFAEALPHFESAYEDNPYNFNVVNNYASTLVQVGNYEKAIPLYRDAMRINPKFEDGMFNLGFSLFQINQFEEAKEWVEKVEKDQKKKAEFLNTINAAIQASKNQ